jgi:hypothetical protein
MSLVAEKFSKLIDLRLPEFENNVQIQLLEIKTKVLAGQRLTAIETNVLRNTSFLSLN